MGLICFTYENFYQFFFYSSKLILISVEITALALSYHLYNGLRHLLKDFSGSGKSSGEKTELIGFAGQWDFKSLKNFGRWSVLYAVLALCPVPVEFYAEKVQVILVLGGSAALYFVGKQLLFFVFFGLIYLLLTVSGAEELVRALVGTLCLQVAFLNLFPFVIRSEREGQCCTCKAREISRKEEK
ncbi:hypothetical protein LguiA_035851 [Lonicera macranthoides]